MTSKKISQDISWLYDHKYISENYQNISKDQQIVATSAHEMEHDLDPKAREAVKARQEGKPSNYDVEKQAYKVSDAVYKEEKHD